MSSWVVMSRLGKWADQAFSLFFFCFFLCCWQQKVRYKMSLYVTIASINVRRLRSPFTLQAGCSGWNIHFKNHDNSQRGTTINLEASEPSNCLPPAKLQVMARSLNMMRLQETLQISRDHKSFHSKSFWDTQWDFWRLGLIAAPALVQCPTLKFNLNVDIFVASQVMEMPNLTVDSQWHWSAEASSFTVSVYSAGRRLSLDSMLMKRCRLKEYFPSNFASLAWKQSGCSACFWSTFWWDRFGRSALVLSFFQLSMWQLRTIDCCTPYQQRKHATRQLYRHAGAVVQRAGLTCFTLPLCFETMAMMVKKWFLWKNQSPCPQTSRPFVVRVLLKYSETSRSRCASKSLTSHLVWTLRKDLRLPFLQYITQASFVWMSIMAFRCQDGNGHVSLGLWNFLPRGLAFPHLALMIMVALQRGNARLPAPMAAFKKLPKRTLPLLLDAGHFDPFEQCIF